MRHYLCLDDGVLAYLGVKGSRPAILGKRRRAVIRSEHPAEEPEDWEDAVKEMAGKWGLGGRAVTLFLGSGVRWSSFPVPWGSLGQQRRMAETMFLAREQEEGEWEASVHICRDRRKRKAWGIVCYAKREMLDTLRGILAGAGIRRVKIIPRIGALALLAGNTEQGIPLLCMDLRRNYVGLYGIWKGGCVCLEKPLFCPKRFIQMGGEKILWEEIAGLAEKTAGGMGEWEKAEVIILNRPYGSGAKEAPSFFQERLKIPCRSVDLSRELYLFKGNPDRRIGAFRPLRPAKRRREGAWTAFILCNGLAAVAVSAFFLFQSRKTAADLYRLQMEYTGSKRETEQAAYQAQIAKDLDKCYGKNGTLLRGFSRLQEELGDRGMVTAVRYSRESGILAVRVLTEDPGSMPDMEEGLRAAGDFIQVSHRMWQRDEETGRILGWLELKLWEGAEEYGE